MEVVVPPADDGSVDRTRSTLTLLLAVFAVVAVVCAGVFVFVQVSDDDAEDSSGDRSSSGSGTLPSQIEDSAERDAVIAQADQFVLRVNTYGPSDLDDQNAMPGYADQVREVITDKFAADFEESGLTLAEQSVAQTGYARSATLFSSGVESLDEDSASVLVAGKFDGSYPDPAKDEGRIAYEPQPFRLRVALVKTQGSWLVDDFTPVNAEEEGQDTAPGEGSTSPTVPDGTDQPSQTPSQTPSQPSEGSSTP